MIYPAELTSDIPQQVRQHIFGSSIRIASFALDTDIDGFLVIQTTVVRRIYRQQREVKTYYL